MKKTIALLLALCLCVGLCACGGGDANVTKEPADTQTKIEDNSQDHTENTQANIDNTQVNLEDIPFAGMWKDVEDEIYWRVQADGSLTREYVLESTTTTTVNGVTTSTSSKRMQTFSSTWTIQDGKFILDGQTRFDVVIDGNKYLIKNENLEFSRIGETDYVVSLDSSSDEPSTKANPYTVGQTLAAEGIELTFSEAGIADDIRITSNSSGIKITSGPSPEEDKQFVYLKGTLKNTGTTSVFPTIGGKIVLDGYEYNLSVSLANEDATPCSIIEPLDSVIILIYAHIPAELTTAFATGEITFGFNDNFETVDISNCDYLYEVDATTLKP